MPTKLSPLAIADEVIERIATQYAPSRGAVTGILTEEISTSYVERQNLSIRMAWHRVASLHAIDQRF
jgi:hypothetical protein